MCVKAGKGPGGVCREQRWPGQGTGDSGHWKAVAEDGRDSSKPPAAPSSWSAPALQSVPGFPVHVEVSMSS